MFNFKVAALSGFLVNNFDFCVSFLNKVVYLGHLGEGEIKEKFFWAFHVQYEKRIRRQYCHWILEKLAPSPLREKNIVKLGAAPVIPFHKSLAHVDLSDFYTYQTRFNLLSFPFKSAPAK